MFKVQINCEEKKEMTAEKAIYAIAAMTRIGSWFFIEAPNGAKLLEKMTVDRVSTIAGYIEHFCSIHA